MADEHEHVEPGSGNVFADLGFEPVEAEELTARAACIRRIARLKERRGWSQAELGKVIGMAQSEVSQLLAGKISRFSLERLLLALNALGIGVRIMLVETDEPHLVVEDQVEAPPTRSA
ncbi:MAG: transcriptional regulator [Cyanobacteria bacterium RYN_339]|nr:transcriptional regulator [Cyanobacteria bacterium RYN_339]